MKGMMLVDDGYPEASDYESNYVSLGSRDTQDHRQAVDDAFVAQGWLQVRAARPVKRAPRIKPRWIWLWSALRKAM